MTTATLTQPTLTRPKSTERPPGFLGLLYELGIEPFQGVDEYKEEQLKRHSWRMPMKGRLDNLAGFVVIGSICANVLAGTIGLLLYFGWGAGHISMETMAYYALIPMLITYGMFWCGMAVRYLEGKIGTASWDRHSLESYKKNHKIPEFVTQTIHDISCSEFGHRCLFSIDELAIHQKPFDPFLIVSVYSPDWGRKEEYYVEVWNESYQKKRKI